MESPKPPLNFREHIRPLIIADTIFTLGLVMLLLVWIFGDEPGALGGAFHENTRLLLGIGMALALGGGVMMLNAVIKLVNARRQSGDPYQNR